MSEFSAFLIAPLSLFVKLLKTKDIIPVFFNKLTILLHGVQFKNGKTKYPIEIIYYLEFLTVKICC